LLTKDLENPPSTRISKEFLPHTWECISRDLLEHAKDENIEKGRKTRIDCTVVESNIHKPFDSVQLFDSVRVLTRLLYKARDEFGIKIIFTDHQRRAKRRMVGIQYAKTIKQRLPRIKICSRSPKKPSDTP
jgi:IS5 family transposase